RWRRRGASVATWVGQSRWRPPGRRAGLRDEAPHRRSASPRFTGSEYQLQTELVNAGRTGGGHHAEVRRRHVGRDALELRMVERVERLQPELQSHLPGKLKVLEQREIEVVDAGAAFGISPEIPEFTQRWLRECRRVEPTSHRSLIDLWIANQIRAVRAERVVQPSEIGRR